MRRSLTLAGIGLALVAGLTASADPSGDQQGGLLAVDRAGYARVTSYIVSTTADSGAGSLREAITSANGSAGVDTINFDIPGGVVQTITPATALPELTDGVIIDGYSQPGAAVNTLTEGTNAQLKIVLDGTSAGASYGLLISAANCLIRGLAIQHWSSGGMNITGNSNTVSGCFVGCDVAGGAAAANGGSGGIVVGGSAASNTIGGSALADRNLISGNSGTGVYLNSTGTANVVAGNLIGLNAAGNAALANGQHGVYLLGQTNTFVGGQLAEGADPGTPPGNVISGNTGDGVYITHGGGGVPGIAGNLIGLNVAGDAAVPNAVCGVHARDSFGVGGTTARARNVISGNAFDGVWCDLYGAPPLLAYIRGNYIGTNRAGTAAVPNLRHGVNTYLCGPKVGGTLAVGDLPGMPPGNVISGNSGATSDGLHVYQGAGVNGDNMTVNGNLIGLNAAGTAGLGNGRHGIWFSHGYNSSIGQGAAYGVSGPRYRNVISGNGSAGLYVEGDVIVPTYIDGILGNYIGTNVAGNAAVPNGVGILFNTPYADGSIGAKGAGAGNVVSGNLGPGIQYTNGVRGGGVAKGNFIGVAADGISPLGNGGDGIQVDSTSYWETFGGTGANDGNVIANNAGAGVSLADGTKKNKIQGNRIYANDLGIQLIGNANESILPPTLQLITVSGGQTTIDWTWTGAQPGPYRVEFFTNPAGSNPQGQTFLGSDSPSSISGTQSTTLPVAVGATELVTATITDNNRNTSEFSAPMAVASQLAYSQQPGDGVVHATLPAVQVAVQDAGGTTIAVDGFSVTLALLNNPSGATLSGTLTQTTVGGVATFSDLQLDQVGDGYTLRASGSPLSTGDSNGFDVGAAAANAAHSTAVVPDGTAGSPTTIIVQARDVYDNSRTTGGDTVTVSISGANTATPSVTDNGDGTYTAAYTPTAKGNDSVAITLGGAAIKDSPYASVVAAGAPDVAQCSLAAAPASVAADGVQASTVSIGIKDSCGNGIAGIAASSVGIATSPSTGVSLTQPASATNSSGVTTAYARSTVVENVVLSATLDANALSATVPLAFTPPADAFEADNTAATAKSIDLGVPQSRSFHSATDLDWCRFVLPADGPIVASTSVPCKGYIFRSDGKTYIAASNHSTELKTTAPAGTYYVTLQHADKALVPYTLTVGDPWQAATPMILGTPVTGALGSGGDQDVLKFTLAAKAYTQAVFSPALKVGLWKPGGGGGMTQVASYASTAGFASVLDAGTWYVTIGSVNGAALASYTATVQMPAAVADTFENDGAKDDAKTITMGVAQEHSFHSGQDWDWVTFTPATTTLVTLVTSVPCRAMLWDSTGSSYLSYNARTTSLNSPQPLTAGHAYLAAVQAADAVPVSSYTLTVGDPWQTATPMTLGTPLTGDLSSGTDQDVLKFTLAAKAETQTVFSPALKAGLWKSDGSGGMTQAASYANSGGFTLILDAGTWYLTLGSATGGAVAAYSATVRLTTAVADSYESDNTKALANTIPVGVAQPHSFHTGLDWDWVAFHATATAPVTVSTSVPCRVMIWDSVGTSYLVYSPRTSALTSPSPLTAGGVYYAAVQPADQIPIAAYTITIATVSARAVPGAWRARLVASAGALRLVREFGMGLAAVQVAVPAEEEAGPLRCAFLTPAGRAAVDERARGVTGQWELAVWAPAGEMVTLSWPDLSRALPGHLSAVLRDASNGSALSMGSTASYAFTGNGTARRLVIEVGRAQVSRVAVVALSARPTRGRLLAVTVELSGAARLRLEVLGLNGTPVRVAEVAAGAGSTAWTWDGRDGHGRRAPAGIYRLRATAVGPDGAQTLAERTVSLQ